MKVIVKFKFNESRDITDLVENHKLDYSSIHNCIWTLSLYYTHICPVEDVFLNINRYLEVNCSDYKYEEYIHVLDKCISSAKKYTLKSCGNIAIRKSEMDLIQSFHDLRKEKIVFVLIALAKYFNAIGNHNHNFVYLKTGEVFKYARVSVPASERDYYYHFVYESGVLTPNRSIGKNLSIVGVVSDDPNDEVVLTLDEYDYKELAYAYLNYKVGGYKRCKECGRWFKIKKSEPAAMYCYMHRKQEEKEPYKLIKCVMCGKPSYVPAKNNRSYRCKDCQDIVNRRKRSEWWADNCVY